MSAGLLIASPLWYGISKWVDENMERREKQKKETNVYGNAATMPKGAAYVPPTWAIVAAVLIAVLMLGFLVIVPMGRAFNCGPRPTTIGLTGTTWGIILLLCLLFAQPLGILLGVIFLIAGRCKGGLMIIPDGQVAPMLSTSATSTYGLGGMPIV